MRIRGDHRVEARDRLIGAPAHAERIGAQPHDQEPALGIEVAAVQRRRIEADRLVPLALQLRLMAGIGQSDAVGTGLIGVHEEEQQQKPSELAHDHRLVPAA